MPFTAIATASPWAPDAHDYQFLPGPNHQMRRAENEHQDTLVPLLIEFLQDNPPTPACRVFMGSLRRLVPIDYLATIALPREDSLDAMRALYRLPPTFPLPNPTCQMSRLLLSDSAAPSVCLNPSKPAFTRSRMKIN